jgi:hypothetical protein
MRTNFAKNIESNVRAMPLFVRTSPQHTSWIFLVRTATELKDNTLVDDIIQLKS